MDLGPVYVVSERILSVEICVITTAPVRCLASCALLEIAGLSSLAAEAEV